jgi:FixJ family two-component response regulator
MKQPAFAPSPQPAGGIGGQPRVVLVEDDTMFRELVETELSVHGFGVLAFSDAESLLSAGDVAYSEHAIV